VNSQTEHFSFTLKMYRRLFTLTEAMDSEFPGAVGLPLTLVVACFEACSPAPGIALHCEKWGGELEWKSAYALASGAISDRWAACAA
jgi:hypothetical protein